MDPDLLELVRQERLLEAAQMASARGQPREASALFERACDWASAAEQALRANDARRALDLALQAGALPIAERAADAVIAEPATADAIASSVATRGHPAWAARIFEATGRDAKAAQAWEKAGHAVRASRLWERLGDVTQAVKVLEAAIRREPDAEASLALGALLIRLGKDEAAIRVLQRIADDAPERREALGHLAGALGRVGLFGPSTRAATEFADRGGEQGLTQLRPESPKADIRLFGRYRILAEIASSPNARVLDCDDPIRGERVVVKVFALSEGGRGAPRARARFERAMQVVSRIDHPNIVPVRAFFPDVPAVVLAWMEGGTLEGMLTRGSLAPARAGEIAYALLSALAEGHRYGILHGDVKPSNVLFDAAGAARLADFGAACLDDVSATATAGAFGSLGYRSPEEREGRPATTQSDVFSVGALLHEMLTGERPGASASIRTAPSAVHPDLNERHDALVARWTARDPAMRPADAFAAGDEIRALIWPSRVRPIAPGHAHLETQGAAPDRDRLDSITGSTAVDTWTGRRIERVALSAATLARARAFALADHPALQPVLRVDRDGDVVWLSAVRGSPLSRPLTLDERRTLAEALEALHRMATAHGAVDAAHIAIEQIAKGEEEILLRFGEEPDPAATFEGDRHALARLP